MRLLVSLLAGVLLVTGCASGDDEPELDVTDMARDSTSSLSESPSLTPDAGPSRWSVVAVERGDRLNVRRQPRASAKIIARLRPVARGIKVGERTSGAWRQVTVGGKSGWAHGRYLAQLGKPVDVTSEARELGIAPTRVRLARKVVTRQAESGDGPLTGPVLVARSARGFTLDVIGYADDAVRGERFVVQVVPGESGFEVRRATATPMCARGVDNAGLCT